MAEAGIGGQVRLVSLTKRFTELAVDDLNLTIAPGEFFSLLGPSGCGKTTTLRMIAGFERPTQGRVILDGKDVTNLPPNRRKVNTVFQNYALFPFLSVFDNVAFGLRTGKLDKKQIERRVGEVLQLVQLGQYAKRRPGQLSGGQQQRVALARALVLSPAVLLLDEPLGSLDAKLRRSLKVELKALQERVGITFLYVTHDQEEALTMSDRVAVMRNGRIAQLGTPQEIYDEPVDTYVADFLGVSNLMTVDVVHRGPNTQCQVRLGEAALQIENGLASALGPARVAIRPERIRIEPYESTGPNRVAAMLERRIFLGSSTQFVVRLPTGDQLNAVVQNSGDPPGYAQGTPLQVYLPPDALRLLPETGTETEQEPETLGEVTAVH